MEKAENTEKTSDSVQQAESKQTGTEEASAWRSSINLQGPKVLGTINLDEINQKTRPNKKRRKNVVRNVKIRLVSKQQEMKPIRRNGHVSVKSV